jgi:hypothetical protein
MLKTGNREPLFSQGCHVRLLIVINFDAYKRVKERLSRVRGKNDGGGGIGEEEKNG